MRDKSRIESEVTKYQWGRFSSIVDPGYPSLQKYEHETSETFLHLDVSLPSSNRFIVLKRFTISINLASCQKLYFVTPTKAVVFRAGSLKNNRFVSAINCHVHRSRCPWAIPLCLAPFVAAFFSDCKLGEVFFPQNQHFPN
jgi:hypothetical protein